MIRGIRVIALSHRMSFNYRMSPFSIKDRVRPKPAASVKESVSTVSIPGLGPRAGHQLSLSNKRQTRVDELLFQPSRFLHGQQQTTDTAL